MDILSAPGRKYPVMEASGRISLAEENLTGEEIARRFVPVLFQHKAIDYMNPVRILYDAVPTAESIFLNYYVHWKDEIHPNPAFHRLYRVFRSVVYGSPADIEFIHLGVRRESGIVDRIAFERDPSGRHDAPSPKHDLVVCVRSAEKEPFSVSINGKETGGTDIIFEGLRPVIFVATWNHIYDFYHENGVRIEDPPLEFMTNDLFVRYYMHRRSKPPKPGFRL